MGAYLRAAAGLVAVLAAAVGLVYVVVLASDLFDPASGPAHAAGAPPSGSIPTPNAPGFPSPPDGALVFAREDGEPIHPQRLTEAFGLHVEATKLARIRLHDLRHTHATLALTNGVPLHVVAARIGDDPRTLLKTYAHLLPTSDAEAAGRIAALI